MSNICKVDDCNKSIFSGGYCQKHYMRVRAHGNPNIVHPYYYKHGYAGRKPHLIYQVWSAIKTRCYNKKFKYYKYYGERGIKVCDEWLNNSIVFISWALSNGWAKGLYIDRIDNNGNYEPSNCRFVTPKVSASNRRLPTRNIFI